MRVQAGAWCAGVSLTIQEVVETARCTVDVFWPFKIKVKLCIKLMFLHACVINFCSFLLFSMLKFPVINITVIFYIC